MNLGTNGKKGRNKKKKKKMARKIALKKDEFGDKWKERKK